MTPPLNINDKADLEMARCAIQNIVRGIMPAGIELAAANASVRIDRLHQHWSLISALVDHQIARIDREAAAEFRTHGDNSAVDDDAPLTVQP